MTIFLLYIVCVVGWSAICIALGTGITLIELAANGEEEKRAYRRGLADGRTEGAFGAALGGDPTGGREPRARA